MFHRCGGHDQCVDGVFCKSGDSAGWTVTDYSCVNQNGMPDICDGFYYCAAKLSNGIDCGGHNQCLSDWCYQGTCKEKFELGNQTCGQFDGDLSVSLDPSDGGCIRPG